MKYFKSENIEEVPSAVIDFNEFDCECQHKENTDKFEIIILGSTKKFKFKTISGKSEI